MALRFNGRIEDVLQSHHFRSGEEPETTLHRYVWLYNQQLPQSALGSKTPLQAMKNWHKLKPELFNKHPYYRPGCDTEQVQAEVRVLQRLDAALSEAQKLAHDAYIGPIRNELRTLLSMVLPGAELTLDADSVLPTGLSRPEGEDSYDQLSGGTQEQIALLVRLAFARLLTKSGTPAPIILDDAIVYTDDDRIERMFNALTQQAGDMQIIVLSCRQKVFRGLGGQTLSIQQATSEVRA